MRAATARRIRAGADFRRCQHDGRRVHTSHLVLLVYARSAASGPQDVAAPPEETWVDGLPARLGLTVSRRVGNAVARNRLKRLVREAFRRTPELWPPDIDLVVIAKRGPEGLGLADVTAQLKQAAPQLARRIEQARADAGKRARELADPG